MTSTTLPSQNNCWIFNRNQDLTLFALPVLFFLIISLFNIELKFAAYSLISLWFVEIFVNQGHLFATILPVKKLIKESKIKLSFILLVAASIILLFQVIYKASELSFYFILAYLNIFHIMRQQYGWLMLVRRRFHDSISTLLIDKLQLWNVMLFPMLWWLSPLSSMPKRWFYENDLQLIFSKNFVLALAPIHLLVFAIYLYKNFTQHIKTKQINWGKHLLVFTSWSWFFGGLIILESAEFFWGCVIFLHAGPYIVKSIYSGEASTTSRGPSLLKSFAIGASLIFIISAVYGEFFEYIEVAYMDLNLSSQLIPLVWTPSLVHYCLDSFIWKKRFGLVNSFTKWG